MNREDGHWVILRIMLSLYVLCFCAGLMGILCEVRVVDGADYGSYANLCDLDDVDCDSPSDDDLLLFDEPDRNQAGRIFR